jgi:receptor expression-enhancing protein 1/2/3/4
MYPAYCSFKAVKTKDVREYVNWMMYWIAFAVFSVVEVFADTFIGCWFPFYYEGKIIFLLWMISSSTRGGAILYRRYIHPALIRHEQEIDACLADFKAKASGAVMKWGYRVLTSMSEIIMQATFRGGEPLLDNFRRTCSMNDLNRGFNQRYIGSPPGGRDVLDGFALTGPSADIYFERNVPVQSIGDHEMIEADILTENNIERRLVRERLLTVDPILEEDVPSDLEQAESRRLRSSTRKRNVEVSTSAHGTLPRKKEKVRVKKTDRTVRTTEKNA